ncbi:tRNA lysidine(34) synthetase TilS [Leucobacter tardus]|uniref:tRNA(Ile)-lysidine synthase n=1 Tax=Leucobacter tardus TaxID=501483 RepID=A0A939TSD8_9MICO|nr:tRNA lysidine(34) synthetase TilS [Leucobacter tardus]
MLAPGYRRKPGDRPSAGYRGEVTKLPPLDPAVAATRRAVRRALRGRGERRVIVALSGGADSLALAAATAFEAPRLGIVAGAVVVDHGLQQGSDSAAAAAAAQARKLGLDPVEVRSVVVESGGGPESAARTARYAALASAAAAAGEGSPALILTGHTRDDQAEQVLLALARGSGTRSIAGIPAIGSAEGVPVLRPFLDEASEVTRAVTVAACAAQSLEPWSDPHNRDAVYARVRVRERILPLIDRELGPEVRGALARSADLAREDADALDAIASVTVDRLLAAAGGHAVEAPEMTVRVPVQVLLAEPAAIRNRIIRGVSAAFGGYLGREHTRAVAALVTDWRGQKPVFVPGVRVTRRAEELVFARQIGSPRD